MNELKKKRRAAREWGLLAFLSAVVLLPIWIVQYPAAADYWNHLLKARIVADYADSGLGYSHFYKIIYLPVPNAMSTGVMALLMKILSPMIAGKVFLSIYALALPFSARYLVRSTGVACKPLEYIGFAMVYNPCLWDGYIDSCLSTATAQLAIGYWLRTRGDARTRVALIYSSLMVLTYFTHLWGLVMLLGVTFALALGESRARKIIWLSSSLMAGAMLIVYSAGTNERLSISYYGITYTLSLARNFVSLPRLAGLPDDWMHFAGAALLIGIRLALFALLFVLANRRKTPMFYVAVGLTAAFFLLPNQLGRMREPGQRTLVLIPAVLAAAGVAAPDRRTLRAAGVLVLACSVFAVAFTARSWVMKDSDLRVYSQALSRIPANRRVLNVVTLKCSYLGWPYKILGSDMYRSEGFFGANYNLRKGGFYMHTFTTGIVKARENVAPVQPWFIMEDGFEWPVWLRSNIGRVSEAFDYIVVVGPAVQVTPVLAPEFVVCWRGRGVELWRSRSEMARVDTGKEGWQAVTIGMRTGGN